MTSNRARMLLAIAATLMLAHSARADLAPTAEATGSTEPGKLPDPRSMLDAAQIDQDPDHVLPAWGIQLSYSPRAFGGRMLSPAQQGVTSTAFMIQFEFQPVFLQKIGVVSLGPSLTVFPTTGLTSGGIGVETNPSAIRAYGGQIRYQAKYFDGQIIVPYAALEYDFFSYSIIGGGQGHTPLKGESFGIGFLMNRLSPSQAGILYGETRIARTYIVAEGRSLTGSDANISASGLSGYVGVRFEF